MDFPQLHREFPDIEWSDYQRLIFDWIVNEDDGHGIVNAVAGSGKTTTLVAAAHLIRSRGLFVAFNKHIATELEGRLQGTGMQASTIHSVGASMMGRYLHGFSLNERKYYYLAKERIEELPDYEFENSRAKYDAMRHLRDICNYARLTLTERNDTDALATMMDQYDLEGRHLLEHVPGVLQLGERNARRASEIDYTDMIYLPVIWDLEPKEQYDWVFVDEAQDLNAAQLEMTLKMSSMMGRMLFVGDKRQAIYGFAGADYRSYQRIKQRTDATELPLSICYRCPTSHIERAQEIVPHIEAREDAPEGEIGLVTEDHFRDEVQSGDVVLCRINYPLVRHCIRLIREGVHARVKGRDIGSRLKRICDDVADRKGFQFSQFMRHLHNWYDHKRKQMIQREATEEALQSLEDRVKCIEVILEAEPLENLVALKARIDRIFDDDRPAIMFSSVHRAKGLENDRVFILRPDKMPLSWPGQLDWQYEQEMNIKYVALTRSTRELYIVQHDAEEAEEAPESEDGGQPNPPDNPTQDLVEYAEKASVTSGDGEVLQMPPSHPINR